MATKNKWVGIFALIAIALLYIPLGFVDGKTVAAIILLIIAIFSFIG